MGKMITSISCKVTRPVQQVDVTPKREHKEPLEKVEQENKQYLEKDQNLDNKKPVIIG